MSSFQLKSSAFKDGEEIPAHHAGDAADFSPSLEWTRALSTTQEFALICEDPDAPSPKPWIHWLLYKIPRDITHLPQAISSAQNRIPPLTIEQGMNSWETLGYRGPLPPRGDGWHRYFFKLYALDREILSSPAQQEKSSWKQSKGISLPRLR